MLTIALAKGRLLKSFIAYLESQGQNDLAAQLKSRERQLQIKVSPFHFLFVKGNDVPIYVEQGIADIGITGSDILNEAQYDVNQLLALPFGQCHFSVAAFDETTDYRKVATSFPKTARDYFKATGRDVELIELSGSIELACVIGMVDGIVEHCSNRDDIAFERVSRKRTYYRYSSATHYESTKFFHPIIRN